MSTNKTEHYQLHSWEPEDDFLRAEFNENFAAIDTALADKARMFFGTYTGSTSNWSEPQKITLGFRPKVVLVLTQDGLSLNGNNFMYGGMAGQGFPMHTTALVLDDTGFRVSNVYSQYYLNVKDRVYYYLALS